MGKVDNSLQLQQPATVFLACNSYEQKKTVNSSKAVNSPKVRNSSPKSTTVVKGCHACVRVRGWWLFLIWWDGQKDRGIAPPCLLVGKPI